MNKDIKHKSYTFSYNLILNRKKCDIALILLSSCLVYLSLIFDIKMLFYIGSVVAAMIFLFVPAENLLYILIFMMPLENMFRGNINLQTISIGLVILLVKLILNHKYKIIIPVISIILCMLIIIFISSLLVQSIAALDILRIAVNFAIISSYYCIYKDKLNDYDNLYINYLILGCFVLGIFSVLEAVLKRGISYLFIARMYGIKEDPNYISSYFAIAISLLICSMYMHKNKSVIKSMTLITIFIIFGLLTQSRGFLISLIPSALVLVCFMVGFKSSTKQKISFISCILFTCLIVMINKSYLINLINSIAARVSVAYETGGTGRLSIWQNIISVLFSDIKLFLFGAPHELTVAAHNLFLDILANYGAIMLVLILTLYFCTFKFLNNETKKRNYIALLPLITMCISYFFLNALLLNVFFYTFVLIVILFNYNREDIFNDTRRA